jgi:chemotaxis protein MotD
VQGAAAAREVLAVLAVDLTARPERNVGPELAAVARKSAGPRGADPSALGADRIGTAEIGDEVDVDEAMVLPVRVVRQEKHFQAAGVEARRWQIAQDAFEGARAAPAVDAQKPAPTDALVPRERPAAPAALARTPEAIAPVAGPAAPGAVFDLAPGAVGLQIADRVQEALTAPAEAAASSAPASGAIFEPDTRQTFAPALRVIKLQLNPAELGTVTIVLSGNDQGLHIELAAELADTVSKVENDRSVLAARLHGAGYTVTDINVARLGGQGMDGDTREHAGRHGGQQEQLLGNGARDSGPRDGGAQQTEQHAGRRSGAAYARTESGPGQSQGAAAGPLLAGVSYAGRFRPV